MKDRRKYLDTKMTDVSKEEILASLESKVAKIMDRSEYDYNPICSVLMENSEIKLDIMFKKTGNLERRPNVVGPDGIEFTQEQTTYLRRISRKDRPGALPIVLIEDKKKNLFYYMGQRELRIQIDHPARKGMNNGVRNPYKKPKCIIISRSYFINEFEGLNEICEKILSALCYSDDNTNMLNLIDEDIKKYIQLIHENAEEQVKVARLLYKNEMFPSSLYHIYLFKEELAKAYYCIECLLKKKKINLNNLKNHDKKKQYLKRAYRIFVHWLVIRTKYIECDGDMEEYKKECKKWFQESEKELSDKEKRITENIVKHCKKYLDFHFIDKLYKEKDIARYGEINEKEYVTPNIIDKQRIDSEIPKINLEREFFLFIMEFNNKLLNMIGDKMEQLWNDVKSLVEQRKDTWMKTKAREQRFRLDDVTDTYVRIVRENSSLPYEDIPKEDFMDIWKDLISDMYTLKGYKVTDLQKGNNRHSSLSFALVGELPYIEWQKIGLAWGLFLISEKE